MSARQSAEFFADFDGIADAPTTAEVDAISRTRWRGGAAEVELVSIREGGHSLPQPYRRAPRILGPTVTQIDGGDVIWRFFERQSSEQRD